MAWSEATTNNMFTSDDITNEIRGCESLTVKTTKHRRTTPHMDNINHTEYYVYKANASQYKRNNELPSHVLTPHINKKLIRLKSSRSPPWKGHSATFVILFILILADKCNAMGAKYKKPLIDGMDAAQLPGYKTSLQDDSPEITARTRGPIISNSVSVEDLDFQSLKHIPAWGSDVRDVLLISGRDHVYMINNTIKPEASQIKFLERLTWKSDDTLKRECQLMGKKTYECQNFIRSVVLNQDETLYVCGTNAYTPTCRTYLRENFNTPDQGVDSKYLYEERCEGHNCPVPHNPTMTSVSLYANTSSGFQLFSALVYDFMSSKPVLSKRRIMTDEAMVTTDNQWFNKPHFIKAIEYGDKVYVFFREVAKEFESGSSRDVVYGRVAQICKDDVGGGDKFHKWTTFLKARITCNLPGEHNLQFNNLTAVSDIKTVIGEDGQPMEVVFATFTTPWEWSDVSVSAVCMFPLQGSIQSLFANGQFLQKVEMESTALDNPDIQYMDGKSQGRPVPHRLVPVPRPGGCHNQKSVEYLYFTQEHPLMYDNIYPAFNRPIFVTEADTRITEVAVDDNAGDSGKVMLYLGTENGQMLKIRSRIGITNGPKAVCVEKIKMSEDGRCVDDMCSIRTLHVARSIDGPSVLAAFSEYMVHIPLAECNMLPSSCCSLIPDCGWSSSKSQCEIRTQRNTNELQPTLSDDAEWPTLCKLIPPTNVDKEFATAGSSILGFLAIAFGIGLILGIIFTFFIMKCRNNSALRKHRINSNVKSKKYRGSLDQIDGSSMKETKTPTPRPTNLDPLKPDSTKYNFNLPTPSPDREQFDAFPEPKKKPEKQNLYADLPTPKEETTLLTQMRQEDELKEMKKQQKEKPNANDNNSNNKIIDNETTPPLPPKAKSRRDELIKKPQRQSSFSAFEDRKRPKPPVPNKPSTLNRSSSMQVKPYMGQPLTPKRPYMSYNRSSKLVAAQIPLVPNMEMDKDTQV